MEENSIKKDLPWRGQGWCWEEYFLTKQIVFLKIVLLNNYAHLKKTLGVDGCK